VNLAEILAHEPDGALHISTLKHIAESPLHFRHVLEHGVKVTKAMRIGTVVHRLVLGPQAGRDVVTWPDTRRGKAWETFQAKHEAAGNEIVSTKEWEEAEEIAAAVLAHDGARSLLEGARCEVPLRWEINGVPFATRGIDLVTAALGIGDMKSTRTANPKHFSRDALKMFYHVQLASYEEGAKQNGIDTSAGVRLLAVESKAPYAVQIFKLTPRLLDRGRRELALWIETLKACANADHWPAYSVAELDLDAPPDAPVELDFEDEDEDEDDETDEAAA
jgi:exodeoxyribonuclease VIII